jgi:hypothetical protein
MDLTQLPNVLKNVTKNLEETIKKKNKSTELETLILFLIVNQLSRKILWPMDQSKVFSQFMKISYHTIQVFINMLLENN